MKWGELLEARRHVRALQSKIGAARARLLALPVKLVQRLAGQGPVAAEETIGGGHSSPSRPDVCRPSAASRPPFTTS